ncbi:hypothetical protein HMI54_015837 [Coelomomyces lativittatus]|nr:hypothetical protein HMI54_015837 [Coelomomyces lativittatus]
MFRFDFNNFQKNIPQSISYEKIAIPPITTKEMIEGFKLSNVCPADVDSQNITFWRFKFIFEKMNWKCQDINIKIEASRFTELEILCIHSNPKKVFLYAKRQQIKAYEICIRNFLKRSLATLVPLEEKKTPPFVFKVPPNKLKSRPDPNKIVDYQGTDLPDDRLYLVFSLSKDSLENMIFTTTEYSYVVQIGQFLKENNLQYKVWPIYKNGSLINKILETNPLQDPKLKNKNNRMIKTPTRE